MRFSEGRSVLPSQNAGLISFVNRSAILAEVRPRVDEFALLKWCER
jgi:hypothetical protein